MERMESKSYRKGKPKIKKSFKRYATRLAGIIGAVSLASIAPVKEYMEYQEKNKIESNADIEVNRKFRNIKTTNMGRYLHNEIERLYEKYPDLDNMIFEGREETGEIEFIKDIYRLYKAFMVDKSEKQVKDMDDVIVKTKDQIISQSDLIIEGDKTIAETHKEQYKMITDYFVKAKESESQKDGTQLAKRVYELLALELGLKDNVLTSQEIQDLIEKNGIYYDEEDNAIYTKEGRAHIVLDEKEAKVPIEEDEGIEIGD